MKAPFKLLYGTFIFISLSLLTQDSMGQDAGGYLMIHMYESTYTGYSKIIVTNNGSVLEEIQLEKFGPKNLLENPVVLNNTLDKYKKQGYSLLSSSKGGGNTTNAHVVILSTYLLEKK